MFIKSFDTTNVTLPIFPRSLKKEGKVLAEVRFEGGVPEYSIRMKIQLNYNHKEGGNKKLRVPCEG